MLKLSADIVPGTDQHDRNVWFERWRALWIGEPCIQGEAVLGRAAVRGN